ncbi:MAG: CoA transferase [Candidatus Cloacimonetes bacterium]|nr:CoA transferase [Candidatus Cloacimonadota bacterium]
MKPLEGIKVLDLTRVLAGPFCTMILSDLGAEIVKVEIPVKGDDSRAFGPFKNNRSLYFHSINRGKKSISLNLKHPKGKEILKDLILHFDILVENYRPGTMEKLGLGYNILQQINPRLIYAASSGFGHSGPYSQRPAYDILAQAMSGMMSITGWKDCPPTRVGMSLGDITASLFTAIGINAALYAREKSGMGQKIDVAMLDCQVAILENALIRYQAEGLNPEPIGNRHPTIAPFQAYQSSDGYFVMGVGNDAIWAVLCKTIGREDLINDPRFSTNKLRCENLTELNAILEPVFSKHSTGHWLDVLDDAPVPCAPINRIEEVINHPQLLARNMIVKTHDPVAGDFMIAGNPIKMNSIPDHDSAPGAPEIGEHNFDVYGSYLGFSTGELALLQADGVI